MNDMRPVIVPRSDQLNADSLLSGALTITITNVEIRPGTEQPISVHYEGGEGKPWKPCKSMARVLVHAWGPDASVYKGRSLTLFCDPTVKWGGMEVGGIRVSYMSHIDGKMVMALTSTKGQRKPHTVLPLVVAQAAPKKTRAQYLAEIDALPDIVSLTDWMALNAAIKDNPSEAAQSIWTHATKRGEALMRETDQPTDEAI